MNLLNEILKYIYFQQTRIISEKINKNALCFRLALTGEKQLVAWQVLRIDIPRSVAEVRCVGLRS